MSRSQALTVLPGGHVDQVARRGQFERDYPDAELGRRGPDRTGSE